MTQPANAASTQAEGAKSTVPSVELGKHKLRELVVTRSRQSGHPWQMELCYQGLGDRNVMFWFELSTHEARAVAAELLLLAESTDLLNAKFAEGGAQ